MVGIFCRFQTASPLAGVLRFALAAPHGPKPGEERERVKAAPYGLCNIDASLLGTEAKPVHFSDWPASS